jgi:predicted transcriptional regulator
VFVLPLLALASGVLAVETKNKCMNIKIDNLKLKSDFFKYKYKLICESGIEISSESLFKKIEISKMTMYRIFKGEKISVKNLEKICEEIGTDPDGYYKPI